MLLLSRPVNSLKMHWRLNLVLFSVLCFLPPDACTNMTGPVTSQWADFRAVCRPKTTSNHREFRTDWKQFVDGNWSCPRTGGSGWEVLSLRKDRNDPSSFRICAPVKTAGCQLAVCWRTLHLNSRRREDRTGLGRNGQKCRHWFDEFWRCRCVWVYLNR